MADLRDLERRWREDPGELNTEERAELLGGVLRERDQLAGSPDHRVLLDMNEGESFGTWVIRKVQGSTGRDSIFAGDAGRQRHIRNSLDDCIGRIVDAAIRHERLDVGTPGPGYMIGDMRTGAYLYTQLAS